jgi:mono/diheme cytochrome c family protein
MRTLGLSIVLVFALSGFAGCDNMWHQDHFRPYDPSAHFPDGASARTPPAHTVPAGPRLAAEVATGLRQGHAIVNLPVPVTLPLLQRGRDCFQAQCAECHGGAGYGDGIVVRRGFPAPPSLHELRLRQAPAGHFYDVMVHGYGIMYPAAARVAPADRWAIVAYIRALQLSQHARLADLPPEERGRFAAR